MLVITDDSTRAEIAEALTNLGAHAKRQQHIYPGCAKWDAAHAQLDALLGDYERADAEGGSR